MPKHTRALRWMMRLGFVLALAFTLFFGVKTTLSALYWNAPHNRDQVIEGWMPLGYLGRSWHVPPEVIPELVGVDTSRPRRRSIAQIAEDRGVPIDELIAQITAAIDTYRATQND